MKKLRAQLAAPAAWLGGPRAGEFVRALALSQKQLEKFAGHGFVVVAEQEPPAFLAGVLAAVTAGWPVVLANPRWGEVEQVQAAAQIRPALWLGDQSVRWPSKKPVPRFDANAWSGTILVPTGGTFGRVRWAVHSWATLTRAARALQNFLAYRDSVHIGMLPAFHIGGLMPAVRALATGGQLWLGDWKTLEHGTPPEIAPGNAIVSLVPTQLQRLLARPSVVEWLRGTRAILLGGAPPTPELLLAARQLRLPITLAYGMTETAAVVAAQTPKDFLAGKSPCATPLPHAKIWTADEAGRRLSSRAKGRIWIQATSLFAGYYPVRRKAGPFATTDTGELDAQGRIRPIGRLDQVINTGGEKVSPAEIERSILSTKLVKEVQVIGLPDAEWGERVVMLYTGGKKIPWPKLRAVLAGKLAPHALPKEIMRVDKLPRCKKFD